MFKSRPKTEIPERSSPGRLCKASGFKLAPFPALSLPAGKWPCSFLSDREGRKQSVGGCRCLLTHAVEEGRPHKRLTNPTAISLPPQSSCSPSACVSLMHTRTSASHIWRRLCISCSISCVFPLTIQKGSKNDKVPRPTSPQDAARPGPKGCSPAGTPLCSEECESVHRGQGVGQARCAGAVTSLTDRGEFWRKERLVWNGGIQKGWAWPSTSETGGHRPGVPVFPWRGVMPHSTALSWHGRQPQSFWVLGRHPI